MMDDPVPQGEETGEEYPVEMIHTKKGEGEIPIPDGGRVLGAEYAITTLYTLAPLAGKPEKPGYESMVGLVGWWSWNHVEKRKITAGWRARQSIQQEIENREKSPKKK